MSLFSRKAIAVATAEFVGTAVLTIVIMSIMHSYIPYAFFYAAGVAVVVSMFMMAFGSISGAHLNPVITLGMWTVRRVSTLKMLVYIAAQFLGAIAGNKLYGYFVGQAWQTSGHNDFVARVLVAEAAGAFIFSLGFASAVFHNLQGPKAAGVVGFSVFIGMLVASAGSGGLINPALALGLNSWVWGTYALGPVLGAIIGFNLYSLLFAPESALIEQPATTTSKPARATTKKK